MPARRSGPTAIGSPVGTPGGCSAAGSKPNKPHARRLSERSGGYGASKVSSRHQGCASSLISTWRSTAASPRPSRSCAGCFAKAVRAFGHRRINQLRPAEIATWRMNIAGGHRFEATQALRQVLGRAVSWGLIDVNPAKQGIDNPQRRYTEKRPFESWAELEALAAE